MTTADPLAGLRPLHTPPPVSWWPPAPGWWLLVVLVLAILVLTIFLYRRGRTRRAALAELAVLGNMETDSRQCFTRLAALLKRYALYCYPASGVPALSGEKWLRFLDEHGGKGAFRAGAGRVFGSGLFQPEVDADREMLLRLVRQWIKANRRRG